jgi:hypothetical protein
MNREKKLSRLCTAFDRIFDIKIERSAFEARSAKCVLGVSPSFSLGPGNTTENLDHVVPLQKFSDVF